MFILEGIIGAGKSTFLRSLQNAFPEIQTALEPLQEWHSEDAEQSLLTHFMRDPHRWAYTMETSAMLARVGHHKKVEQQHGVVIAERSVYSGHFCFALNGYKQGFMNALEWHAYTALFEKLVVKGCAAPRGILYLRVEPEVAYQRIAQRKRAGEEAISLEYLTQLHEAHENFLIRRSVTLPSLENVPVLVIPASEDFEHNSVKMRAMHESVRRFINRVEEERGVPLCFCCQALPPLRAVQ
jgi:deoxynucleoside kinase